MDFEVSIGNSTTIGFISTNGTLWFDSCCDGNSIELNVHQAIILRAAVDEFISSKGSI